MSSAAGARDGKDTSGTVASQQEGHGFQSHSGLFFVFSPCVGVAYGSSISNLGLTDNSEPRIGAILLSVVCLPAINGRLVVGVSPPSPLTGVTALSHVCVFRLSGLLSCGSAHMA